MSLTTILLFTLGYAAVLIGVMCVLVAAKRADRRARAEHAALVRSMTRGFEPPVRAEHDLDRTRALLRRTG